MGKNLLEEEKNLVEDYEKNLDKDGDMVLLTPNNVAIIEFMINHNSSYSALNYIENYENEKNSKYYIKKYKEEWDNNDYELHEETLRNIIACIDNENSTHLNSDGCGREEILDRLLYIDYDTAKINKRKKGDLEVLLINDKNDYELINILSSPTHPEKYPNVKDKKYNSRQNASFATKFCHYMSMELFKSNNPKKRDQYSIFDNVILSVLKRYIDYYDVDIKGREYNLNKAKKNGKGNYSEIYKNYQDIIAEIIKNSKIKHGEISRNGFDHLLWYYYKGNVKK